MLIRSGSIPIDAAMPGFCVTARTFSPSPSGSRVKSSKKGERQEEDRDRGCS